MQLDANERQQRYKLELEQMKFNNDLKMKDLELNRSVGPADTNQEEVKYKGPTMPRFNEDERMTLMLICIHLRNLPKHTSGRMIHGQLDLLH